MKVRMRVELSGSRNGVAWPKRGGILDLPDAEGADYCANGLAEPVAEVEAPVETAVVPEPEKRVEPVKAAEPAKKAAPVKAEPKAEPDKGCAVDF